MGVLFCAVGEGRLVCVGLSGGVMVALGPLEASVMVRIHAGQPVSRKRERTLSSEFGKRPSGKDLSVITPEPFP